MVKLAAVLGLACLCGIAIAMPNGTGVIKSSLLSAFLKSQKVDIVINFKQGESKAYSRVEGKSFASQAQRIHSLRSALIENADDSQKAVRQILSNKKATIQTFWLTNRIIVKNADLELVNELAKVEDVSEIREEIVIPVQEVKVGKAYITPKQEEAQWGVQKVNAHQLWAKGNKGKGIVVASVDTGVRGTHRILAPNFRGDYGWYEPTGKSAAPRDDNGHGTHTMGTIAGQEGYGIAPEAEWISCMGCAGNSCFESDLLACGEFIFCPTDTQGQNADCSKAPHVVSNSWGSTVGADTWYDAVIKGWHDAKIIVVFSAGNAGPFCESVGSPGDRDVIGVGATDINDRLAFFSSVGPSWDGQQKPEISAPGDGILSSFNTGDTAFSTLSGTSMACPHVSGSIALLLGERPELVGDYDGVRDALFNGATRTGLEGFGVNCNGVDEGEFPNYAFGYGRLDVLAASMTGNKTIIH